MIQCSVLVCLWFTMVTVMNSIRSANRAQNIQCSFRPHMWMTGGCFGQLWRWAFWLKGDRSSAEKKDELLSLCSSANVISLSKILLCSHTNVFHKPIKVLRTFATPWPKHWLQNKTGVAEYNCGRGPSQLIHKGFKWEFKKKKKGCFVVGRMSCVGYQSRLFPVCGNRHRLCLGYTPPQGVAFKMTGLWWENCVFLLSKVITVRTDHRVVLQCNLLMSAFLHLVSTFSPPPPPPPLLTSLLQIYSHRSGKVKAVLLCWRRSHWSRFQSVVRPRLREEEQETWHSTHPSWLCITSSSPRAGLLVTCFFVVALQTHQT